MNLKGIFVIAIVTIIVAVVVVGVIVVFLAAAITVTHSIQTFDKRFRNGSLIQLKLISATSNGYQSHFPFSCNVFCSTVCRFSTLIFFFYSFSFFFFLFYWKIFV